MANINDEQIQSVFDLFDADGSGWVDMEELGLALRALGFGELSRTDVEGFANGVVSPSQTHVDYEEFKKIVTARMVPRHSLEELWKAFSAIDVEGKGRLSLDDLVRSAVAAGVGDTSNVKALREQLAKVIRDANVAFPNTEDDHDAPADTINRSQWRSMMRMANATKRKKADDDSSYDLKTRARIAKKGPFGVQVEAGKTYFWCSCGMSKTQPFCDGSHAQLPGKNFQPVLYEAHETRTVWFCGCKQSSSAPLCDGTHTTL